MRGDSKFIIISILLTATLVSLSWILSTSLLAFVLKLIWGGRDIGLAALLPAMGILILGLAFSFLSLALMYPVMIYVANRLNVPTVRILHPGRDFLIGLGPSLVLAGLLVYGFISLFNWSYPLNNNSHSAPVNDKKVDRSVVTPTPMGVGPTVVPSTLPGDETLVHTMPVPTTIAFAPVGSVEGASTSAKVSAVKTVMAEINQALKTKDNQQLYSLLSSQLTAMFSADSMASGMSSLGGDAGLQLIGEPQISDDWAKQQVRYVDNGKTSQYLVVLHLENGQWKLFGTAAVN